MGASWMKNGRLEPVFTRDSLQIFRESLQIGQEFVWREFLEDDGPRKYVTRTYVVSEKFPWFVKAYQKRNRKNVKSFMYADLMIAFGKKKGEKKDV